MQTLFFLGRKNKSIIIPLIAILSPSVVSFLITKEGREYAKKD
jgi:hypothetical protein